jgi:hypothetical protein
MFGTWLSRHWMHWLSDSVFGRHLNFAGKLFFNRKQFLLFRELNGSFDSGVDR